VELGELGEKASSYCDIYINTKTHFKVMRFLKGEIGSVRGRFDDMRVLCSCESDRECLCALRYFPKILYLKEKTHSPANDFIVIIR
jgi:hypothetical protein